MKQKKDGMIERRFGSRKVLIVFIVCWSITVLTMIVDIVLTFVLRNQSVDRMIEHAALCTLGLVLMVGPVFIRSKFRLKIPAWLHITVTVFIFAHFVLGEIFRLYDHSNLFDKILHVTSGVVIGICGFSIVYVFNKKRINHVNLSPFFVAMFAFCFAVTLLTLWEVFEFTVDSFFGRNMQRWKDAPPNIETGYQGSGLIDTMVDIIVGMIGAAVVCVGGWFVLRKYPDSNALYMRRMEVVKAEITASEETTANEEVMAEDVAVVAEEENNST